MFFLTPLIALNIYIQTGCDFNSFFLKNNFAGELLKKMICLNIFNFYKLNINKAYSVYFSKFLQFVLKKKFSYYCYLFMFYKNINYLSIISNCFFTPTKIILFYDIESFSWCCISPLSNIVLYHYFYNFNFKDKNKRYKLFTKTKNISFTKKKEIKLHDNNAYSIRIPTVSFMFNNKFNYIFFFLRKNKCFNKGRYSRNRQNYRTGFYWCLYVNVVALLGLNLLFYKFAINFSALWFLFFLFLFSFIFSRILKYNFIVFTFIFNELKNILNFFKNLYTFGLFL